MRSRRRRGSLIGFAGLTAAVTIGSYAWACTQDSSHSGLTWLCTLTQTVSCNFSTLTNNTNPTRNLSFYSQASGLTNGGSYDMRWVTGDHTPNTDQACKTGTIFNGGHNLIASSTGVWSGQGPLTIPNDPGMHTVCAQPLPGNNPSNFIGSKHTPWTFT